MSSEQGAVIPPPSGGYRFVRWLLRLWLGLSFPTIRLLEAEALPPSGPVVLVVNHPASFLDALILVATFEREVGCLVHRRLLRGEIGARLARALRMIPYDDEEGSWKAAAESCLDRLTRGSAVVVFAEPAPRSVSGPPAFAVRAATLAIEAESRLNGEADVALLPVHLSLPVAPSRSTEVLIYLDAPLQAAEYAHAGSEQLPRQARRLAEALDRVCHQNAFRLQPKEFARLLSEVEVLLRADLEADWASRPNWKQTTEGFRLSRFVEDAAEQLNNLHPGRLVALGESLEDYRETARRASLSGFEAELAGTWLKSPGRRLGGWIESVLGFPVALYGLANHAPIAFILFATGLLRRSSNRAATSVWATRGLVLLACYAILVALSVRYFGRAVGGSYAVSLPFSGAYLWRYVWLLRHRTRLLFFAARARGEGTRLARLRKQFIEELNEVRDTYSEFPGAGRTPA